MRGVKTVILLTKSSVDREIYRRISQRCMKFRILQLSDSLTAGSAGSGRGLQVKQPEESTSTVVSTSSSVYA